MSSITRKDLFLLAMKERMFCSLAWSFHAFSITEGQVKEKLTPYRTEDGWKVRLHETGDEIAISDASKDTPVYAKRDTFSYKAGDFIGAMEDGTAGYAKVLWHHIVVVFAFSEKIPFDPSGRNIADIEKITAAGLVSNPKAGEIVPAGKFTVAEHLAYTEALSSILTGLAPLFTPSTTERSLVTDPNIRKVRAQRLKENEGRLTDPAVISSIKNELVQMDKDWLKGDDAADYLVANKKSFDQVRVKTLGMHGEESAFSDGTSITLIETSLDEGLNLDHMPEYANSVRQASYNRGSETALGGELTQFLIRLFQNHSVAAAPDCGTKAFLSREIPPARAGWYEGMYIFEGGKNVLLTNENITRYAGKTVALRSPQFCKAPGNTFCSKCIGEANAAHPDALGGNAVDIGNIILYVFMKKAHGGALKTNAYDFEIDLH